ncbi:MAG: hypothetical protein HYY17_10340 [Planctomycetes bacterium]|nr:hypothetical protein [Planctomycetota bacterium]
MIDESRAERTSALAVLSLLAGLGAAAAALGAYTTSWVLNHWDLFAGRPVSFARHGSAAVTVTALCAAVPAFAALLLGIAARAAVRESEGRLRGISLYRMGILVGLLSCFAAAWIGVPAAESKTAKEDDRKRAVDRFHAAVVHRLRGDRDAFAADFAGYVKEDAELSMGLRPMEAFRVEDVIDPMQVRVLGLAEAQTEFAGRLPIDEARRRGAGPDDLVVVAPIRAPKGTSAAEVAEAFFAGGQDRYVWFVLSRRWNDWRIVEPGPKKRIDLHGGSPRYVCPVRGCSIETHWASECRTHGRTTQARWYGCLDCWVRSPSPGECARCGKALKPYLR